MSAARRGVPGSHGSPGAPSPSGEGATRTRTIGAPHSRYALRLCVVAVMLAAPAGPAPAQGAATPEARLDLLAARSTAVHLGAGVSLPAGRYVRPTVVIAAGPLWQADSARASGRVDVLARFVLDPFRESRVGLYAQGGLTTLYDPWERWRAALAVGIGAELPARAGGVWALEVGLGGGVRFGLALRRAVPGRR